jgi:hypothetical protein
MTRAIAAALTGAVSQLRIHKDAYFYSVKVTNGKKLQSLTRFIDWTTTTVRPILNITPRGKI